ncbi:MAG: sensor histidine kinase [Deltaproteobacteria bacterium]|nr:sensor histidine kinase [Deltaproteobacteria bacterium]
MISTVDHNYAVIEREELKRDLKFSEEKLQFLTSQLLSSQEGEKKRIFKELHEDLGQNLAYLKITISNLSQKLGRKNIFELKNICNNAIITLNKTIENLRRLCYDLRPHFLDDLGLTNSLRELFDKLIKNNNIKCKLEAENIDRFFNPEYSLIIFRIFEEAIRNVINHSKASEVALKIRRNEENVYIELWDNGKGFDLEETLFKKDLQDGGMGIYSMMERARLIGGSFHISSRKGQGTAIHLTLPVKLGEEAHSKLSGAGAFE